MLLFMLNEYNLYYSRSSLWPSTIPWTQRKKIIIKPHEPSTPGQTLPTSKKCNLKTSVFSQTARTTWRALPPQSLFLMLRAQRWFGPLPTEARSNRKSISFRTVCKNKPKPTEPWNTLKMTKRFRFAKKHVEQQDVRLRCPHTTCYDNPKWQTF